MNLPLDEKWAIAVRELEAREAILERKRQVRAETYSGLKDLDLELELVKVKLKAALQLVEVIPVMRGNAHFQELRARAQRKAREATGSWKTFWLRTYRRTSDPSSRTLRIIWKPRSS